MAATIAPLHVVTGKNPAHAKGRQAADGLSLLFAGGAFLFLGRKGLAGGSPVQPPDAFLDILRHLVEGIPRLIFGDDLAAAAHREGFLPIGVEHGDGLRALGGVSAVVRGAPGAGDGLGTALTVGHVTDVGDLDVVVAVVGGATAGEVGLRHVVRALDEINALP